MKSTPTAYLVFLLLGFGLSTESFAFPGPRQTLEQRWSRATVVVYAEVEKVEEGDGVFAGQEAELSVLEGLKGWDEPAMNQKAKLSVVTHGGGCPYPFDFQEGQHIIAFLVLDPQTKKYTPWGAAEGCIEVDKQAYRAYFAALKTLQVILAEKNPPKRNSLLRDWYVACACNPATRVDGVGGLPSAEPNDHDSGPSLSRAHEQQLLQAILSEKRPSKDVPQVVRIFKQVPSAELDAYLLQSLRLSHEQGWQDLSHIATEILPLRLEIEISPETAARLNQWQELSDKLFYGSDYYEVNFTDEVERERFSQKKQRLDILWGTITAEYYSQCKAAMDAKQ